MMANKSGVPGSIRKLVMARDGYSCRTCGITGRRVNWPSGAFTFPTEKDGVFLSIDHIVPKSRGGELSAVSNLRVLCTTCNSRKGTKEEVAR